MGRQVKVLSWTSLFRRSGIGIRVPRMISRSNPRDIVVSKVARGTSGSKAELEDAAMDVVVSMKASRGERTWPIPLPLLICQRRRKRTLVQMAVPLRVSRRM